MNSKLLLPRSSDTIKRERLNPLLDEIPKKRLTTVIAGAGYGKTTLIAQVGTYLNLNTVWYRLEKSDKDFITFLNYLTAGIKQYFPEFGAETFRRIDEAQNLNRERKAVLTVFLSEIYRFANKDLIIVLDDYHFIQESQEINESLKFLLEHLPPLVHLIIISRTDPGFPLSRFRALREVLDIGEEDLVFTMPEAEQLYSQLFYISLQDESLKVLYQKTDGWVSGLILFYHSIRGKSLEKIEKLLLKLKGSHQIISNYLEENVYDLQPEEIKLFLVKASILSRINARFCNQLFKINNSRDILIGLERNHLFTFPFDEEREWYHYHHLFQDFLQTKIHHELDQKAIRKLHKDAAILWEKQDEDEEALKHYLAAEEFGKACRLLSKLGRKLIKEGRLQLINSYLKKIPGTYLNREPWIQYTKARVLELTGKPPEAIRAYKKAHKTFRKHRVSKGVGMSLFALGANYYMTGDFPRAEKRLKELLKQVKDNPRLCIEILGSLIFISSHLGKIAVADQYFNDATSLLAGLKNKDVLAWLYFNQGFRYCFSGDSMKALKLGEQTKKMCENLGLYHLLAFDYHLISWSYYSLGHFSEGMQNTTKGLDLVKERGFQDSSHAWLLTDSALNSTALGEITSAINDGKESLKIFQDLGSNWGQAWAYHVLCDAHMKCGNLLAVEECAVSGIEVIEGLTLPMQEGILKGYLARSLIEREKWEDAGPLLEDAEQLLKKSKLNISRVYLLRARFFWEQKQKEAAINNLISGLQLCEANQYDIWIVSEKHWIIPLLVETFAQGKMQGYLQRILEKIGPFALKELVHLQKRRNSETWKAASNIIDELKKAPPPALKVYCLGKFRVFRGDEEIPTERWKNKKAKMLFKFLLYKRSHGYLTREVLMELLWPEEDPGKTANRLRVTLTSLRKTLEPEILRGTPSSYLLRDGDAYKLHLGDGGWMDIDTFREELKLAKEEKNPEKSISHYLNAEVIYHGNFFEEERYTEWCAEAREIFKEEYLDLLTKIMEHFENKGDYPRCIEYSGKYLKLDKYAENIYQQLMKYYSLIGNKTMVARVYERCKDNIMKGLDSQLSKETETLYQRLASY